MSYASSRAHCVATTSTTKSDFFLLKMDEPMKTVRRCRSEWKKERCVCAESREYRILQSNMSHKMHTTPHTETGSHTMFQSSATKHPHSTPETENEIQMMRWIRTLTITVSIIIFLVNVFGYKIGKYIHNGSATVLFDGVDWYDILSSFLFLYVASEVGCWWWWWCVLQRMLCLLCVPRRKRYKR